ncbi:MAG: PQQ-dependent sugar dehydrogenase [Flavobacteriales bacterium]|nr:PQQ-dependent sugar dehydrogenase [Flavobacteriales bacterium]
MIRKFTLLSLFSISSFGFALGQPSTVTVGNTTLDVRVVIQGTNSTNGIDIPWEITWGPDDHIWMTERYGRVSRLNPETGQRTTILDLTNTVYDNSEAGLLGLALHPDFENTPQVFLAYTYSSGGIKERVVRYDYNSTSGMLENPLTLVEGINGNTTHIGCRLFVLPDNTLLATTGDYQNQSSPQNETSVSGKILRMNFDGSIPDDNPFGTSSYIYSKGHRNAQGLALAPNGILYSSEHGPTTNDEFNIIVPGGNYGWPDVEGFCTGAELSDCNAMTNYQDPLAIWYQSSTIAPSDLIWYDHPAIPEWQGKMLMTVLKAEHLKVIEVDNMDGTTVVSQEILFNNAHANNPSSSFSSGLFDRLRDICMSPDGRVFLATNGPSWGTSLTWQNSIIELKNSAYIATSVEHAVKQIRTQVYPNPSSGSTNLVFDEAMIGSAFSICDQVGRVVYTGIVSARKTVLDLSDLAPGLYTLLSSNSNYSTNERILITE